MWALILGLITNLPAIVVLVEKIIALAKSTPGPLGPKLKSLADGYEIMRITGDKSYLDTCQHKMLPPKAPFQPAVKEA